MPHGQYPYPCLADAPKERRSARRTRTKWVHAFEGSDMFSDLERKNIHYKQRRLLYKCSLEAHVEELHEQMHSLGICPPTHENILDSFHGLNTRTGQNIIASLYHDIIFMRTQSSNKLGCDSINSTQAPVDVSGYSASQPISWTTTCCYADSIQPSVMTAPSENLGTTSQAQSVTPAQVKDNAFSEDIARASVAITTVSRLDQFAS
ncbi:hypothetical protein BC629DRAFT_1445765 [Irpex lacteus]|nr:hypothetical protein BC629DRAFT_1445765 [Irpex lacteus]